MTTAEVLDREEITPTLVPEQARLGVLPKFLGKRLMVIGENVIYSWMQVIAPSYNGGLWNFYELSNGGFFMAPANVEKFSIEVHSNGYSGVMSAEAAGITACLYAFCQLANHTADPQLIQLYHDVRAYAVRHFESSEILRAID